MKTKFMPCRTLVGMLLLVLVMIVWTGCSPVQVAAPENNPLYLTPFRPLPPEAIATITATPPGGSPQSARPSPTPNCINNLRFLTDVTIPDGTKVKPSASMDKQWQVENSGSCNWDDRYSIRLVDGNPMGAAKEQPLFPTRSGSKITIRMAMTAPSEVGKFSGKWQAVDPQGNEFGDYFSIEIFVAK